MLPRLTSRYYREDVVAAAFSLFCYQVIVIKYHHAPIMSICFCDIKNTLGESGTEVLLASCDDVGTFQLSDNILKYKYVFIIKTYYANTCTPSYGSMMIPTSVLKHNSELWTLISKYQDSVALSHFTIKETSIVIDSFSGDGNYIVVWGIK